MWGMIYGYARVSTEAQDLSGSTAQLKAAGCQKIYREKITGTTADRPQLKKLVAVLAHGDVVIVPAVDRLSRDTTDLMVIAATWSAPGQAFVRWSSQCSIRRVILQSLCLPWLAWPRSWNATASPSEPHEAAPRRRKGGNLGANPYSRRTNCGRCASGSMSARPQRSVAGSYNVGQVTISRQGA
jgi:hypothetical protein